MADATSDDTTAPSATEDEDTEAQELLADAVDGDDGEDQGEQEGAEALGDAGKKALQATKDKWKSERDRRRELERELAEARKGAASDNDGAPDAEQVRTEAEQAATAKANQRIVRSEVKAAAAGKLADPADALLHIDVSKFDVDDDGEIDSDEVAEAIEELVNKKPYLAAQGGRRFQGTADGGARKGKSRPQQLTREDVKRMSPQKIVEAKESGRLDDALGITTR